MALRITHKKRLMYVTIGYWCLLAYITAALVWWFISLEQQNQQLLQLRLNELIPGAPDFEHQKLLAIDYYNRKHGQYVGEGLIFMLFILVGAVIVYQAIRRFIKLGQQQQNFMMAITHELKTPISVVRLNVETMQRHKLSPDQTNRLLQLTLTETERLNELCNNILLASRFEKGRVTTHREKMSLSDIVQNSLLQFEQRYSNRVFIAEIAPEVIVEGDPLLLPLMFNNLLENAIKYAPKTEPITIQLYRQNIWALLSVADLGQGVAPAERQKIFKKFYRQGNEETRKKPGTGLGLYLAARIANEHDGDIVLTNNTPQGAKFTIRLPAVKTMQT